MRVKAIRTKFENCPPAVAAFGSNATPTHLFIGKEYEVFSVSVFQSLVFVQIINDSNHIAWLPTWFFESCDSSIAKDWICTFFSGELQMVMGPSFVAKDLECYNQMVELDPVAVSALRKRYGI
jgi:hypothetical protein